MPDSHTVFLSKCSSYGEPLAECVAGLFSDIDPDGEMLKSGKTAFVKPNLLTDRTPAQAVTTHPEVVRAVIRHLRELGMKVRVGDSPASAVKVAKVWEKSGIRAVCAEENVELLNLEEAGSVLVKSKGYEFNIAKDIYEADIVINLPKLKSHTFTTLTAAVKNYYGTLPGYQKMNRHKAFPKPDDFGEYVAELSRQISPSVNLIDAVIGMEGNGPSAGEPVELGFLAAGLDAFALDLTICRILKIAPSAVPYLRKAAGDYGEITVSGLSIEDVSPAAFKMPGTLAARLCPRWVVRFLDPYVWVRPEILDSCIACRRCVEACPADALHIDTEQKKAVLNSSKCISCCCCHEVCPEKAIEMKQSPLLNLIRKGRML